MRFRMLALIALVLVGGFVWWFAPLGLYSCDTFDGVRECYLAEDDFEVTVARAASAAGGIIAIVAGIVLVRIAITRGRAPTSA